MATDCHRFFIEIFKILSVLNLC